MDFNSNKPIYLQIYESVCDRILCGEYPGEGRLPSVREYAAQLGVNPNTLMRTYERLTSDGLIYNRRGIGYFVSPDAPGKIKAIQREAFMREDLPRIKERMALLEIDPRELFS